MRRGEVWWASLHEPEGSMPVGRRPVLVLQSNSFNEGKIRTVIVASITGQLLWAKSPGNVLVHLRDSGLSRDSVVNVSQVIAANKVDLTQYVSSLPPHVMSKVNAGVRLVLGL